MRIGILCEGRYTDGPVLQALLDHAFPSTQFIIRPVDKRVIFSAADNQIEDLFGRGANRALVLWDLLPTGHQMPVPSQPPGKESRGQQRRTLLQHLCASETLDGPLRAQALHLASRYGFSNCTVPHPNNGDDLFKLVCVCYALDGWLLSDGALLRELASTDSHTAEAITPPSPDRCKQPANWLMQYFSRAPNRRLKFYNKEQHNIELARAYIRYGKVDAIRASASFRRVVQAIEEWTHQ